MAWPPALGTGTAPTLVWGPASGSPVSCGRPDPGSKLHTVCSQLLSEQLGCVISFRTRSTVQLLILCQDWSATLGTRSWATCSRADLTRARRSWCSVRAGRCRALPELQRLGHTHPLRRGPRLAPGSPVSNVPRSMAAASLVWPLSTCNVASATH